MNLIYKIEGGVLHYDLMYAPNELSVSVKFRTIPAYSISFHYLNKKWSLATTSFSIYSHVCLSTNKLNSLYPPKHELYHLRILKYY